MAAAKRRSIARSPCCCAKMRPSSNAAIARAILPLANKAPPLRKILAYCAPFAAASTMIDSRETRDSILGGALTIIQPVTGYRFAIDSILLADFARPRRQDRVLELGCGCGVI